MALSPRLTCLSACAKTLVKNTVKKTINKRFIVTLSKNSSRIIHLNPSGYNQLDIHPHKYDNQHT